MAAFALLKQWFAVSALSMGVATVFIPAATPCVAQTAGGLSNVSFEGFVHPRQRILVAPLEAGRIEAIGVEIGQRVVEGEVLAQLEDDVQSIAVEVARIQTEAQGEMTAAVAQFELNRSRAEKLRELAANGNARPDELERAEGELVTSQARVVSLREQLALRRAELRRAEILVERRKVRATGSGVIAAVLMQPGEYVSPSQPAIVELLVDDQMIGLFDVPSQEASLFEVGARVKVRLVSTGQSVSGNVASIAPKIDGESGTVEVRVDLNNTSHSLISGDRCTMKWVGPARPNAKRAARLPQAASGQEVRYQWANPIHRIGQRAGN